MKKGVFIIFFMVVFGIAGCSIGPLISIGERKQEPNFIDTAVVDVAPIVRVHKSSTEVSGLQKQNEELKKENKELIVKIERLEKEMETLRAPVSK